SIARHCGVSHELSSESSSPKRRWRAALSRHLTRLPRLLDFLLQCEVTKWVISSAGRAPPLQGGGRRFDPVITHHFGSLAQLVEQLTFNQLVAGSNPARPTNVKKRPKGAFLLSAICEIA